MLLGFGYHCLEVVKIAQLRQYVFMATFFVTNGPGYSYVTFQCFSGVVFALPVLGAYGVDGREVDSVKTHVGHQRDNVQTVLESTMLAGLFGRRPWEKLIPGTVKCLGAIYLQR